MTTLQTAIPALVPTPEQLDAIALVSRQRADIHYDRCPTCRRRDFCQRSNDLEVIADQAERRAEHARRWRESRGLVA
jgi:Zn-finger nucleic acid-binding protein